MQTICFYGFQRNSISREAMMRIVVSKKSKGCLNPLKKLYKYQVHEIPFLVVRYII